MTCCPNDSDGLRTDDLVVPQGSDRSVQWPIVDGNGDALPSLTGWTARAQARENYDSSVPLASWTTEAGGIILAISTLTLVFTAAQTTGWTWSYAVYDIELIDPYGKVARITQGQLTVDPEVTR